MLLDYLLLATAVFCFGMGTVMAWLLKKRPPLANMAAHGLAAAGSLAAGLCGIRILLNQQTLTTGSINLPLGDVYLRVDPLSAWFLLALGIVGVCAAIYSWTYSRQYYQQSYSLMAGLFNLFLISMLLVFAAAHVAGFLIAWEMMAIISFLLVNHEHEKAEVRKSAFMYVVTTHVGTAFLIMAFLLLGQSAGSFDFAKLRGIDIEPLTRNVIFFCCLIGFGAKCGVMPLHIWMPRAYPAAPGHAAAVMSGVMIKTAIYGLCRFFLDFLVPGPAWWGYIVLCLAVISAVLGVLYALMENDLKKLLAYSSVENVGVLLFGIGSALVFGSQGKSTLAAIAWTAVLYHSLNHALFKSLLFLVAGSVLQGARTTNLERLGGLIRTMPYTSPLLLLGCIGIAALPPLNGFVSEWLTLQSVFFLTQVFPGTFGRLSGVLFTAVLAMVGALAAACFVKLFGVACLGKPRSQQASLAMEVPLGERVPIAILAGGCLVLGVWPQPVIGILQTVLAGFPGLTPAFDTASWQTATFQSGVLSAPLGIVPTVGLLLFGLVIAFLLYRLFGTSKPLLGETWTCGIVPDSRMQYSSTGFSKPIRRAFQAVLRPRREVLADSNSNIYFGRRLTFFSQIHFPSETAFRSLNRRILHFSRVMKQVQTGNVQVYIGYIMAATIAALLWSTGWKP